jgi:hypothetical protein
MKRSLILISAICLALLPVSCGSPTPSPEQLLARSADVMKQVQTVQWAIQREGSPIEVYPDMGLTTLGGEGVYQAPGQVHAIVKVQAGSMVAEAEILWTPDGVYFKLPPLQPAFTLIELPGTFSPADLFSTETGIPYILTEKLTDAKLVGEEDLDGTMTNHITATAQGEDLSSLVGGAVGSGTATVDLWIDQKTDEILRIKVTEADGSGWVVDLFAYGEPVEIPVP